MFIEQEKNYNDPFLSKEKNEIITFEFLYVSMIFLGHCPDSVGLVAKVSSFFADHDVNITDLEEHTEQNRFFLRIESDTKKNLKKIENDFCSLADEISMEFSFCHPKQKTRVVLFCSQTLHCPLEILSQQLSGASLIEIITIISNSREFESIARRFDIPFFFTKTSVEKAGYEAEQIQILKDTSPDLVALGRYMKILSPQFLAECPSPIINIHHSFLPSFVGGRPYEMAYERGVKMVGATAHFVTKDLDEGPIIAQGVVPVRHTSSIETMKHAGANVEKSVFAEAIQKFSERKIIEWQGRTVVFR